MSATKGGHISDPTMDSNAISRLVAERRQLAAIQMQLQPMPMMPGLQFPLQPMVSQAQMQQFLTQQQMFTFGQQAQIPMQMIDPQQQTRDLKQRDRDDDDDGEDDKDDDRYDDDHYDGRSNRRERRQRERSGRDRDRGRDRSRDRSRDRDRDYRDRDYRGCEDKGSDSKWMTDTPTNTILLKGLPNNIDEKDICGELMIQGLAVKDVRLMKRKDTGESRGFAFAEFQTVDDATQWMEQNQGEVMLLNEHTVRMFYSTPKSREGQDSRQLADWTCSKCGFNNFKRREQCHKCYMTRTESERLKEGDGYDQVGTNPCNTLILRGLDALTTEENIISAISKISALQVKNVKVLRDDLTGTSRGYGFVELGSLQESTQVLATLHRLNHPFEIDGKAVVVSFAKNTYSTVIATMSQSYEYPTTSSYDAENGGSSSQPFDGNNRWGGSGFQNYDQNFQTDKTNAAAAVAQAALQAAQAAKAREKQMEETAGMSAEEKLAHQAAQWSAQQQQQLQDAETTPATSAALTTYRERVLLA
ncbi:hypothetical protein CAPTEDRAFT_227192 [Capitella teleta]|uniref:RNA-binding protein 5 n=1 Tax=Capitella teleta TaxID=283909 RepID=R7U024_CAPTE|nr:hypothetical protein CAPTEDRAFT_227192 [Capitella teleta]|eukprot:ELT96555.1 hypothetical protein CAPTEDRAFT_227192 [Capitella teleta]